MPEIHTEFCIEREVNGQLEEIELQIAADIEPYQPAVTWGPADNWTPAEGGIGPLNEVTLDGKDWDGALTKEEIQGALDAVQAAFDDDDSAMDEDDYEDRRGCADEVRWETFN